MITSKLDSRARTTIPQAVRAALKIRPGDEVAYSIEGRRVILTKAASDIAADLVTTFNEWASANDRRAYAEL